MRVAIVGLGAVGEACAHLLTSRGTARSLVLANRTIETADAVRIDLEQSRSWSVPLSARSVTPWQRGAFQGCDVIVLTVGPRLRGSETRAQKAQETAKFLVGKPGQSITEALTRHVDAERQGASSEPKSVLLVVTNPVEATMTWLAETTSWERRRIIGLGTTVDTARFSRFLADKLNVDASSVWTEIVGEHGPLIDVRDRQSLQQRATELGAGSLDVDDLLEQTRSTAAAIRRLSEAVGRRRASRLVAQFGNKTSLSMQVQAELVDALSTELSPPATRFAIAAAVVAVVEAIASDRGQILPVSGFPIPALGKLPDVAVAMPFVVGRAGLVARGLDTPSKILATAAKSIAEQVEDMRAIS
jgi:L-lactate dehydrogenase